MKKSTFLKLTLVLPALAITLASCSKKESPFITGGMKARAIQKEFKDENGVVRKVFAPDIICQAISDTRIIRPIITSSVIPNMVHFTPYPGHVETEIESSINYKSSLRDLNGTYTFSASNERAQELTIWTGWAFDSNHEFSTGWGEFADNENDKKITKFSYRNGTIDIEFKTIPSDVNVSYYVIIMDAEEIPDPEYPYDPEKNITRLVRDWWGARQGDAEWPITASSTEGHFTQDGFNEARFDKKKVFLAAVKDYGDTRSPMMIMLLSNPKTINIEKGVFDEDIVPEPPTPVS